MTNAPSTTRVLTLCVGAAVTALSTLLPWVEAGVAGHSATYDGTRLGVLLVAVLAGSLLTAATSVAANAYQRPELLRIAAWTSGLIAAVAGVLIVGLETASNLVPSAVLPSNDALVTLDASAGAGLWLAFAASAAATLVASNSLARRVRNALSRLP